MKAAALFLLYCFHLSFEADSPPPVIDVASMVDCEDNKVPPPEGFMCETEITGEGPAKAFNAKLTLPFDLDDSIKYRVGIKKWIDEAWKEMSFKLSGSVCEHGPKYLPGVWEKLSKAVNVSPDCPVKAGAYTVDDFKAETTDVKLPFSVPGKFLASVVVSKDDKPFACKQAEITITKP